jgi:radical SAM superfamily enzyme YgiQ (UPF0313 family)
MTDEVGIQSFANMMFAHPGETTDTIRETTEFMKELDYSSKKFWFSWAVAYPGSQLFDELKARGVLKNVDEVRDYVLNLGNIGKYVYNFTDIPRDQLTEFYHKMYMDINRSYYFKRKDYVGYLKFLMGYPSNYFYKFMRLMHLLVHPREFALVLERRRFQRVTFESENLR